MSIQSTPTAVTGLDALTSAAVPPSVMPLTCPGGEHLLHWVIPGEIAICSGDGHKSAVWKVVLRRGMLVTQLVAEWSPTTRLLAETLLLLRAPEREPEPARPAPARPAILTQDELEELGSLGARSVPVFAMTVPAVTTRGQPADYPRGVNGAYRKGPEPWWAERSLSDIRNGIEASRGDRTILWKAFRARHPHAPAIISQLLGCSLHSVHQVDRGERVVTYEVALRLQAIMALPAEDDQPAEPPGPMRLPDAVLGLA